MGNRASSRHRRREPLLRNAEAPQRSRYLDVGRSRALIETYKLFGYRDECPNDRMGFTDAIPPVSGPITSGGLHASGCGSQYGGVLALAFAPLWAGDLLERRPFARPGAEPHLCRSFTRGRRAQKAWASTRQLKEGQQGRHLVQRRLFQRP